MRIRFVALLSLFALCLLPTMHAGGKKKGKTSVTFHIQTSAEDNPKMIFPQQMNGELLYFRRMPEIMTQDIESFDPFPAEGGQGYGVTFKLNPTATRRLSAITNVNRGRWLLAQVNGRVVDGVLIDSEINDGKLVVWRNITLADISILEDTLTRVGQDGKKKP